MAIKKWYGRTTVTAEKHYVPAQEGTVTITSGTLHASAFRRSGPVVSLDLVILNVPASNSWATIGTISQWIPDHEVGAVANGSQLTWLRVTTGGEIQIYAISSASVTTRVSLTWMLMR